MGVAWHRFTAWFNIWFKREDSGRTALGAYGLQMLPINYAGLALILVGVVVMMTRLYRKVEQGRVLYELGNDQWDLPQLRTLLEELLSENDEFNDFEVEHVFEGVGRLPAMSLVPSRQENGGGGIMVDELIIEIDLTARKEG